MKRHFQILLSVLMAPLFSFTQSDSIPECKFCIKTLPLNLIDVNNGSVATLGTEIKAHKNISLYTEFGYYFTGFVVFEKLKGFIVKEEIKFYSNKKGEMGNDYISLELCYSEQSYFRTDRIDTTALHVGPAYEKRYSVSRKFPGIVIQYGTLMIKRKRLVFDLYGGLGIRLNNVVCDLTQEEAMARELGDWTVPANWTQKCGKDIIMKVNFGLRIGYKIK